MAQLVERSLSITWVKRRNSLTKTVLRKVLGSIPSSSIMLFSSSLLPKREVVVFFFFWVGWGAVEKGGLGFVHRVRREQAIHREGISRSALIEGESRLLRIGQDRALRGTRSWHRQILRSAWCWTRAFRRGPQSTSALHHQGRTTKVRWGLCEEHHLALGRAQRSTGS